MKTFDGHLKKKLADKKINEIFNEEKQFLSIAVKIAEERNKLNLSQKELAARAKITQQQLSKIENGVNCNVETLLKICNTLNMKLKIESSFA